MAVTIKSKKEIELMREAGKMLEEVHNKLADFVKPGISTLEIDQFGEKAIRDLGCVPNFLNYNGYPASICVSVNDEVVHGIPSKDRILQDGDIVSLDAGLLVAPKWSHFFVYGIKIDAMSIPDFIGVAAKLMP